MNASQGWDKKVSLYPDASISLVLSLLLAFTLVGCSQAATPTATNTPLPEIPPTFTSTSTVQPTPSGTATPWPIPTASITPTSTITPTPDPLAGICPGAPAALLQVDGWARVNLDPPVSNRIRSEAGFQGTVTGDAKPGEALLVLGGPRCVDDYTWWLVRTVGGLEGWTADGDAAGRWLVPLNPVGTASGWQQQSPASVPSPRKAIGMVYDPDRKVVVMVGGTDWEMVSGETWEYDGLTWRQRKDVNLLPARTGAAMAYDSDRHLTVLFGGSDLGDDHFFNDTWEYDGNQWVQSKSAQSPPPRNGAAMAYDSKAGRMLLFGGYSRFGDPRFLDDTWEYINGEWRQLSPEQHPEPRETARMAYDAARDRLVLFGGGHDAGVVVFQDTWEWYDGSWHKRTDLGASLPARWAHMMVYDEACQRVLIFGGLTGLTGQFDETWSYDGTAWKRLPSEFKPPARWDGGLAYDPFNHRLVLFGGQYHQDGFKFLNDTWYGTFMCER